MPGNVSSRSAVGDVEIDPAAGYAEVAVGPVPVEPDVGRQGVTGWWRLAHPGDMVMLLVLDTAGQIDSRELGISRGAAGRG